MTAEHADRKIKEILTKVQGQGKLAEQAVRALAEKDHSFLLSLVEPYLNGVILHGIERARKSTGLKEPSASKQTSQTLPKTTVKPTAKKQTVQALPTGDMDHLMKAWAKSFETGKATKEPGQTVSQKHVDALKALVKNPNKIKK